MADALHTLTIAELAPKIKAKEISPVELTDAGARLRQLALPSRSA